MNAHTSVAPAKIEPVPNTIEYAAAIFAHYPQEAGIRLAMRCDLMAFRDRAAVGLMRCRSEAGPILAEASRLATIYALANIPTKALFQMHRAAQSLLDAASAIEAASALSARSTSSKGASASE